MMRVFVVILTVAALAGPLAACGKKGAPQPPGGKESQYPRQYPAPQ